MDPKPNTITDNSTTTEIGTMPNKSGIEGALVNKTSIQDTQCYEIKIKGIATNSVCCYLQ